MVTLRSPIYGPGMAKLDMSENRACPRFDGLSWFIIFYHGFSWFTMVISRLYHGYIMVNHIMVISLSYHGHIVVISWLYNGYIMVISRLYQGSIWLCHVYIMVISWLYQGSIWLCHGYIMVISWSYHGLSWFIMVISWFIFILF